MNFFDLQTCVKVMKKPVSSNAEKRTDAPSKGINASFR